MNAILKRSFPHIIAILTFVVLSAIYFAPQLKGYIIKQHDIEQYIGMSKEIKDYREKYGDEPLWTNSTFGGMPAFQISVKRSNIISKIKGFVLKVMPKPIGFMFFLMLGFYIMLLCFDVKHWIALIGGIAFGLSSLNLLYLGAGHDAKIHAISFLPPIIGGIYMAYRNKIWQGAIISSIFVCLHVSANHLQMTYYLLYLILAIVIVETYKHVKAKAMPQFLKASAILLVAGGLGVLPTLSNIITTKEYSEYTTRGKSELTLTDESDDNSKNEALERGYIKTYSLGKGEIWSLVFPNVKGAKAGYIGNNKELLKDVDQRYRQHVAQQNAYWGEQATSGGAFYMGAALFLLFILGALFIKDKLKWAFIAVTALAVMISWKYGTLVDFFIDNVPMFNKFRDTKMMLMLVELSLPFLGLWFVQKLITEDIDKKKFLYVSLSVSGLFLLFYIAPQMWFDFLSRNETEYFSQQLASVKGNPNYYNMVKGVQDALIDTRIEIYKKDCLRSLFFIVITAVVIYLYLNKKLKTTGLLIALGVIVTIDIWSVSKRYLNNEKKGSQYQYWEETYDRRNPFRPSRADMSILENEFKENPKLRSTIEKEVTQMRNSDKLKTQQFQNEKMKKMFSELNFATDYRVISMQNPFSRADESYFHKSLGGYHGAKLRKINELIEYQISKEMGIIQQYYSQAAQDQITNILPELPLPTLNMLNTKYIILDPNRSAVINPYSNGNAWFINDLKIVASADEEIMAVSSLDTLSAVIQSKFESEIDKNFSYDSTASITLKSYKPNHLVYESNATTPQFAVFSEIYYPAGWNAYIDGEISKHVCADYALRAMNVPAGKHTVEFKFEPQSYYNGQKISMAGSGLIVLFVLFCAFMAYKENQTKTVDEEE